MSTEHNKIDAPRFQEFLVLLAPLSLRDLGQKLSFLARQALDPALRNLVEYTIELVGFHFDPAIGDRR